MWTRDLLKTNAKQVLRNNYWMALLVTFTTVLLTSNRTVSIIYEYNTNLDYYNFGHRFYPYFYSIGAAMGIGLLFWGVGLVFSQFVSNIIFVGKCRYFMESRVGNAPFSSLFSAFGGPAYLNTVKTMFFKNLFIFLWSLLFIFPGIYKSYQYRMVDYLLAENPYMPYQRALELSRAMTDGEKLNMFVLDLSFLGWYFLGAFACGIGILFVNPYHEATYAELYAALRAKAFALGLTDANELGDFIRY